MQLNVVELEGERVATHGGSDADPVVMADDLNVFETAAWERELGPARGTRVGAAAGSRDLGCSLYEVDPGGQATP
jgi:hypothetical protein